MKTAKTRFIVTAVLALTMFVCGTLDARTLSVSAAPQTRAATTARVVELLQQSGYTSRKTRENTWVIERPSKGQGWMLAAAGVDFVVVGIIVAEKKLV